MARNFVVGSTQYYENTSCPISSAVGTTIAVWARRTSAITGQIFALSRTTLEGRYNVFAGTGADRWGGTVTDNAGTSGAPSFTTTVDTNWHHVCLTFDSSSLRTLYLDGSSVATNTTALGAHTTEQVHIGTRRVLGTLANYWGGDIAECGAWNAILDTAEIASLAKGVPPIKVRPQSLEFYCPLVGKATNEADRVAGYTMTASASAPTAAAHPRVYN